MIQIIPGMLQGAVSAPPSKSFSIRALVADYLAGGGSVLENLSGCEDVLFTQRALTQLRMGRPVDCGESALALHLMAPVAALQPRPIFFTAQGTLRQRPLSSLAQALHTFGAQCSPPESGFPLQVEGPLRAGEGVVDGRLGSQAMSGLLMALPLLEDDSCITLRHPVSLPYIDLTLDVMLRFGVYVEVMPASQTAGFCYRISGGQSYRPTEVTAPRDWSAAAAIMAAAAVSSAKHQGAKCVVKGLGAVHATAPDSVVIEALRSAGVLCTQMGADWEISVPHGLNPFVFDLTHAPDLAPALAALAAYALGVSLFKGAGRLKSKESSRGEALARILGQLGVTANLEGDELTVHGGKSVEPIAGAVIDSHHDHRIAMAVAIAATGAQSPVFLSGESCVAKTYPRFWDDLASLGLSIHKITP
ncbi:MAG: hypothetical protein FWE30_06405 [Bacteroidales bacterium]|nr:hypothetical protein [Bacteroidales bacterium]